MIKTFKCKETEKLFHGRFSAKLPQAIQRAAVIKLKMLHAASILDTLRIPPPIIWKFYTMTARGNTASESTNNGAYASFGKATTPLMLKSLIIIKEVTL
jgi:hypothetical protein